MEPTRAIVARPPHLAERRRDWLSVMSAKWAICKQMLKLAQGIPVSGGPDSGRRLNRGSARLRRLLGRHKVNERARVHLLLERAHSSEQTRVAMRARTTINVPLADYYNSRLRAQVAAENRGRRRVLGGEFARQLTLRPNAESLFNICTPSMDTRWRSLAFAATQSNQTELIDSRSRCRSHLFPVVTCGAVAAAAASWPIESEQLARPQVYCPCSRHQTHDLGRGRTSVSNGHERNITRTRKSGTINRPLRKWPQF